MRHRGARVWYFPDGYLPPPGPGPLEGHESLCILNPNEEEARIRLEVFFADRPPLEGIELRVGGKRDVHVRLDRPEELGGITIPREVPYGLRLVSDRPIVAQLSRMDTRQSNLALFTSLGYPADDANE